jgi:hypothetical protein
MTTTLRRLLFEDLWLKLFALLVAVWIYATVRDTQGREEARVFADLPVLILSTASDRGEVKTSPDRVTVTLRGDSRSLDHLLPRDIHPVVDLTLPGALAQRRHRIVVSVPPGVTASDVTPNIVEVTQLPPVPP